MKQFELNNGIDHGNLKIPHHIDPTKIKFEVEDLRKLIKATTNETIGFIGREEGMAAMAVASVHRPDAYSA